jgi:2-amino-4-hydroxy-6-hydroxymethyldihydropteridine diphosphokinase
MNFAVVAVGSNIEPQRNIDAALALVASRQKVAGESRYVRTKAIGRPEQGDYLNGAWLVQTALDRDEFAEFLKGIEQQLGRIRTADKYAARPIDLDLVVWNGSIVDDDIYTRDFLRNAVLEVAPDTKTELLKAGAGQI